MAKQQTQTRELAELLERMEPWLIGLWRFRVMGQSRQWAVTFSHHGYYWDTDPENNAVEALTTALRMVEQLDAELGSCPFVSGETGKGLTLTKLKRKVGRLKPRHA